MEKNTGKVREFCQSGKVGTMIAYKAIFNELVKICLQNSLGVLMEKMSSSQPVFIRCIKPNGKKSPKVFEDDYVEAQVSF